MPCRRMLRLDSARQIGALRGQQHDACTQGQTYARQLGTNQLVEHLALFVRQHNFRGNSRDDARLRRTQTQSGAFPPRAAQASTAVVR